MKASASRTALLLKCAYSFRDDVGWPKEKPSPAAARGTKVHAMIADFVNRGTLPSFDVDDWALRRAMQGIQIAKVHLGDHGAEMAFAMSLDGGTDWIGKDVSRDAYPNSAFCGTADFMWSDETGSHIRDWKTGSPSDAEEWQLRALAAMQFERDGKVASAKAIYLTDSAPRFGENVLEGTDPKEDAATIRKHLKMTPDSEPTPGHWCKSLWCPARKTCKAVA